MKKRFLSILTAGALLAGLLAGCAAPAASSTAAPAASGGEEAAAVSETPAADLTGIDAIIAEAETMTMEELAKKAIEESNGKTFYGVGNSSRGKSALPVFIEYLQSIDPNYTMEFEWQQPKNNKIFEQLTSDSLKSTGTFAMTLIQDGNQIQSKMVDTNILKTFIPKEWADANGTTADAYAGFLPLQTLNKVFEFNNTGDATYTNCWDFVYEGSHPLFMGVDSEIVGKNFLMMLTSPEWSDRLAAAYEAYYGKAFEAGEFKNAGYAWIDGFLKNVNYTYTSASKIATGIASGVLPQPISPACWFIPSFVPLRNPQAFPLRTSLLLLIRTTMKVSAATATATICS